MHPVFLWLDLSSNCVNFLIFITPTSQAATTFHPVRTVLRRCSIAAPSTFVRICSNWNKLWNMVPGRMPRTHLFLSALLPFHSCFFGKIWGGEEGELACQDTSFCIWGQGHSARPHCHLVLADSPSSP